MEKLKKRIDIVESVEFDADYNAEHTPINVLADWIEMVKQLGATHIDWHATEYYGDRTVEAQGFYYEEETDEEFKKRKNEQRKKEREIKLKIFADELAQYELLKKKFDNGKR